ncbi:MAG: hypothetical protein K2P57_08555 [Burkholderiales bacterium]|nr:hypothetical protein [Burkholderiales bacterium]
MKRVLGIEEAWVENAVYFSSSRDNDANPGRAWNFGVQWDAALSEHWGSEVDAPGLLAQQPLGRAPSALAPITIGLKYVPLQWDDGESAGVLGAEVEGSWWASPQPVNFPGVGSNIAGQILVGIRRGRYWIQGEYGASRRVKADARSGWFADSALGYRMSEDWVVQIEIDLNRTSVDALGHTASSATLTPQVGWQIDPAWQLVLGESIGRIQGAYSVMTDVLLEYGFDESR